MQALFPFPGDIFQASLSEILAHFAAHQKTYIALLNSAPTSTTKNLASTCLERLNALYVSGNAFRALDLNTPPDTVLKANNNTIEFLIQNQVVFIFNTYDFDLAYSLFYYARFHYAALIHALKTL